MGTGGGKGDAAIQLPLQAGLKHRGALGREPSLLFPPPGALEALGGCEGIARLVDGLYDRIEADPALRPAFSRDLTREREKQKRFFEEWLGHGAGYFNGDWPPGLTAAHGAVSISRAMAERWLGHFLASLAHAAQDPNAVRLIEPSVTYLARGLVNRPNEPVPGERLRCSSTGADLELFLRRTRADGGEGARASASLKEGPRCLVLAALRGKTEVVQELLRAGVDPNTPALVHGSERSASGLPLLPITPLCGALARRRTAVAGLLVEQGAHYDVFTAAFVGDVEAVRELLDRDPALANAADPASDVAEVTPLMHAVAGGHLEVVRLLLERNAELGRNNVRLVRLAANAGHEALLDLLLEHGAQVGSLGVGEWVLYPVIAERLLARGADVNETPGAWIWACCTGNSGHKENEPYARALLRCGADVRAPYRGRTALHHASKAGFARVVEAIIEHGGDVNAVDEAGRTPLDAVEEAAPSIDREPVRRLLISHGARRARTSSGR